MRRACTRRSKSSCVYGNARYSPGPHGLRVENDDYRTQGEASMKSIWGVGGIMALALVGCVSGPTGIGKTHDGALADDLNIPVTRGQAADEVPRQPQLPPMTLPPSNLPMPSKSPTFAAPPGLPSTLPPTNTIQPVSMQSPVAPPLPAPPLPTAPGTLPTTSLPPLPVSQPPSTPPMTVPPTTAPGTVAPLAPPIPTPMTKTLTGPPAGTAAPTVPGTLSPAPMATPPPPLTAPPAGATTPTRPLAAPPATSALPSPPGVGSPPPTNLPGNYRISVKAWVNGKPLFEDEVFQGLPPQVIREIQSLPEAQRNEKLAIYMTKQIDAVIDQEVMYQDAVAKLEKGNPRALDKLKSLAQVEYEKQLKRIRDNSSSADTEEQLKQVAKILQRKMEREFIASEYMRSRIFPKITSLIGSNEVRDYYETHRNEFQKVEKVHWQDIFIAVGPKHPTLAAARRYAEDLIAQCRTVEDFEKLLPLDEGDSKLRGGEGFGNRRGEIKPAEVEDFLFKLRDGEIGPVVELSTGVHIIRLLKKDPGGPIPFTETVQLQIRNRLRNEVWERELKRLVRELRSRAVIEIEAD